MKDRVLLISDDARLAQRVESLVQRLPVDVQWQPTYQPPSAWPGIAPAPTAGSLIVLLDENIVPDEEMDQGEGEETTGRGRDHLPTLLLASSGVRRYGSLCLGFIDVVYKDQRLSHLPWVLQEHLSALRLRRARQRQESEAEPDLDPNVFSLRHEINNPLSGILGNAELALAGKGRLAPEVRDRLERIVQLAVQIREMLQIHPDAGAAGNDRSRGRRAQSIMMSGATEHTSSPPLGH